MTLLENVKANLILEHSDDDSLIQMYITAAVSYAESYQHRDGITRPCHAIYDTAGGCHAQFSTKADGSTGGFFADNVQASQQVWDTVNMLLRLEREQKI